MDMDFARQMIEQYGYLAVFASTVIEGEFVVLAAAAIASAGLLEAHWVIAAAALGAWVGHLLLFAVGRWKGMQLIESVPVLRRHYPKANLVMDRYANWSVFVCQYLYGMRLVSAMLFGCSTITLARFMALQVINCIIWALLAYFAGHMIGVVASQLFEMIGLYGLLAVIAGAALVGLLLYQRYGHHHVKGLLADSREVATEQVNAVEGRHFALQQLEYHMQLAGRSGKPLSMLLLRVPQEGGSGPDDKLEVRLSLMAHELCRLLRLTDIPARFDRDSFAILAPDTDIAGAKQAVQRLQAELQREGVDTGSPQLSIGMTEWQPGMSSGDMLDACFRSLEQVRQRPESGSAQGFDVEAKAQ